MALVKSDFEASGKLGGVYFKKDKSGQHIQAMPRKVQLQQHGNQRDSKSWYAGKKREEHAGGPPIEQYELPKTKTAAIIYSIEEIWAFRQPSFTSPLQLSILTWFGGSDDQLILDWINNNWLPIYEQIGFTKDIAHKLLWKWFATYKYTYGFNGDVALTMAKARMSLFFEEILSSVCVPLLSLWGGLVAMQFYYAYESWLEGKSGFVSFNKGRVLIRTKDTLYWGGLLSRDTREMYKFMMCYPVDFQSYVWDIVADTVTHQLHFLNINELWQTDVWRLIYNYVYTWKTVRCRYRGTAYLVGAGIWQLQCDPAQREYWEKPIGYFASVFDICGWLDLLSDYFQYQGHPQPPL